MSSLSFTPSSSLALFSNINQSRLPILAHRRDPLILSYPTFFIAHNRLSSKSIAKASMDPRNYEIRDVSLYWDDEGLQGEGKSPEDDGGSPWEGALVYKRNASVSHVEYCTTLERLGLGRLSTEVSKARAFMMGLSVTKAVKDYPSGTPVQVSVDVTRKRKKLRLDGIIKTVLTLECNRCCKPIAECIYSNFSLLLTEEQVEEPDIIDFGTIYDDNKFQSSRADYAEIEDYDEASIDWDDRLYFPPEEKEIDISKNIRDLVHIEITIDSVCDQNCRGLCLKCGTNLNTSSCNCNEETLNEEGYGPLKDLKKRLQSKY